MNNRFLAFGAFGVALAIVFGYVSPTWSGAIATTRTEIASDDAALASARLFSENVSRLSEAQAAVSPADLLRLFTLLPDSANNIGMILDLNALAAQSGLSITDIQVADNLASPTTDAGVVPTGIEDSVQSIDIALSALGSYSALKTFLMGVEKSQRLLDVRDLSVKGSDTGVYTYQIKIRVYWLR